MATITIKGNLNKSLNSISKQIKDMTPAFKRIADFEWSETKLRMKKEVSPEGKRWLEPITIRRNGGSNPGRRSQAEAWKYVVKSNYHAAPPGYHFFSAARGDKILRDTGSLFASIGRAYGSNFAKVGTDKEYAQDLQDGIGKRAPRPFIGINKKTYDNVQKVVTFYLKGIK